MTEYARALDLNRPKEVAALFTEDGAADYGAGLGGRVQGREALEHFFAEGLRNVTATSHHVSNIQVRFEGPDTARATTYLYAWHRFPDDRPDGELWGQYHDRLERTASGWRIAERKLHTAGDRQMGLTHWHPLDRRRS